MAEVSTVQQLPAPFIEAAGKTFLEQLQTAIGGLKGADLSKVMGPQFVAPTSAITQEAQALRGGLGSFAPFLQTAAATTGPTAYQQFMSPYQQDVIDTTLREFDVQAAKGIPSIAAQAVGRGVLGGGREGVIRSEYQTTSDRNRAALQAQLLQQGFGQAQQAAQQQFMNQMGLAQAAPTLAGQQISALGALGTQQQAATSSIICSTAVITSTTKSTVKFSSTIRSGCYGINIWIPSTIPNSNDTYAFTITNSPRSWSYISRSIQSV